MINELRGSRPFPVDFERKERCQTILSDYGMTMTELAFHIGIKKSNLSNIISGRDLSPTNEQRIATFWRSICNNRKCTRLYNLDYYGVYNKYKRDN